MGDKNEGILGGGEILDVRGCEGVRKGKRVKMSPTGSNFSQKRAN